jgi:lysophospholipase L1-like esterase
VVPRLFKRAIFVLAPLVVVLGGGEAWQWATGWPHIPAGAEFTHNKVYWVEDPNLRLEPVPHRETGGVFRVSTDQNGLRAPLHPEAKPPGAYRVMPLGCSTTFGWGVDDDQSYPARLEAILNEGGHKVEVINGGQPGYSSFQGLWLWDKALKKYSPDVVIFGYVVQDSRMVQYSDTSQAILQGEADFLKQNLLHQSKLYLRMQQEIDRYRAEKKDEVQQTPRIPEQEYVDNIKAFKALAEGVGAKFMLFGFPLERAGYTEGHRRILHAAAEKLGVPIYDPQPEMETRSSQETLYFPQDRGHANAAGNDVIAQGMAQFLVTNSLVP